MVMALRIWPKDFERKDHITKEEKALLRSALQSINDGHFAVGIDPVGMSNAKVRMGLFISPDRGLLTFSVYTDNMNPALIDAYINYVTMVENKIYERLLDSKMLIVRNGDKKVLKFPYKHSIIFANDKPTIFKGNGIVANKLAPYAYMQFLTPVGQGKSLLKKPDIEILFISCFKKY